MKKLIFVLLVILIMASCSSGLAYKVKQSVIAEFPNAILIESPVGRDFIFIVIDSDSSVYYVSNGGIFTANKNRIEKLYSFGKGK